MEKQYGPRAAVDARLQPPRAPHTGGSKETSPLFKEASRPQSVADHHETDRRSSLSGRGSDIHDSDSLQETVKHQKYEIVRLLNTVKTLSNENTTLLKVREGDEAVGCAKNLHTDWRLNPTRNAMRSLKFKRKIASSKTRWISSRHCTIKR
jgi:hypothetical protein